MSCFKILRRIVMMAGDPLKCCPVASECSGRLFSRFQQSVLTSSRDKGGLGGGLLEVRIVIFLMIFLTCKLNGRCHHILVNY